MELHNLKYTKGARGHKVRTYGRGFSSGLGKTSGRGQKGQHSRQSGNVRIGFEGGQTPIYRKIPKVGFNNFNFKDDTRVVTIDQVINAELKEVTPKALVEKGLLCCTCHPVKLIGGKNKITKTDIKSIEVNSISKPLQEQLTKLGVKVTLVEFIKNKPVRAVKLQPKKAAAPAAKKATAKKVAKK